MGLKEKLHNISEKVKGTKWQTTFGAIHTLFYTPNETTHSGSHIRGADDLKRTMTAVIIPLIPVLIFAMFNVGFQQNIAINGYSEGLSFFSGEFWNFVSAVQLEEGAEVAIIDHKGFTMKVKPLV